MLTGKYPFSTTESILQGKMEMPIDNISAGTIDIMSHICLECLDLLRKIFTVDSKARITLEGIMNHPWVKSYKDEKLVITDLDEQQSKKRKVFLPYK
jgi:hypothetical protein